MKKHTIFSITILVALMMVKLSGAQTTQTALSRLYVEGITGPSSKNGAMVGVGVEAVWKNKWVTSVSYTDVRMNPRNLPGDYERGYVFFIIPIYDPMPESQLSIISVNAGRFFEMGRKTWLTTTAGFSYVSGDKFSFAGKPIENDILYVSSNYAYQTKSQSSVGAMLKADFNWAFSPYSGLGVGVFTNLNGIQVPVGVELKLLVGWMHLKKKAKVKG